MMNKVKFFFWVMIAVAAIFIVYAGIKTSTILVTPQPISANLISCWKLENETGFELSPINLGAEFWISLNNSGNVYSRGQVFLLSGERDVDFIRVENIHSGIATWPVAAYGCYAQRP